MAEKTDSNQQSLTERTSRAANWEFTSTVVKSAVQLIVGIVLARLLPPEDFGLIALASIIVGFTYIFADLGFAPAIIQRRPLTEKHIRTGFTLSVILGFGITVLITLLSPYSTLLLDNPELPLILAVLSLTLGINGFGSISQALLQRNLEYGKIFRISFSGQVVNFSIAISMALMGYGVWSLVAGTISGRLVSTVLNIVIVRHNMRPLIRYRELKDLASFGFGVSLNQVINYSAKNGDNFVIGSLLGAAPLGLYNRAYNLMNLPNKYFASTLSSVLFPAFSEIQDNLKKFRKAYLESTQLISMVAAPIMTGVMIAAPYLIEGLYGEKWTGAIVPLQILALGGYFRALYHIGGSVSYASDNVYRELMRQIGYAVLVIGGAYLGSFYGINGTAVGITFALIYMYFAMAQLSLNIIKSHWLEYFRIQLPGIFLAFIVGVSASFINYIISFLNFHHLVNLLLLFITCTISLGIGLYILPRNSRINSVFGKIRTLINFFPRGVQKLFIHVLWVS